MAHPFTEGALYLSSPPRILFAENNKSFHQHKTSAQAYYFGFGFLFAPPFPPPRFTYFTSAMHFRGYLLHFTENSHVFAVFKITRITGMPYMRQNALSGLLFSSILYSSFLPLSFCRFTVSASLQPDFVLSWMVPALIHGLSLHMCSISASFAIYFISSKKEVISQSQFGFLGQATAEVPVYELAAH